MGPFELSNSTTNYIAAALCASIIVYALLAGANRGKRYPPGPKGLPIIGNLLNMPIQDAHLIYRDWSKKYGDMIFFKALGQPFLILSSEEVISDLLDKRSTNYSSRPRMPMVVELMGWTYTLGLLPYGDRWRFLRREFHRFVGPTAIHNYRPIEEKSVYTLLNDLLDSPENFYTHLRLFYGSISMKVSYGYDVKGAHDPYLVAAEGAMAGFLEAGIPGRFWVDLFPLLKYVPNWMPGAEFKRKAARWSYFNDISLERPFNHVLDNMKKGIATTSVAAQMIEELPDKDHPERKEKETVARNISATTFLAGVDTIHSVTSSFFYAMVMYPEVQRKAQQEIDAVVGDKRLPSFEDRDSLPYVRALVKELVRWSEVAPVGIQHCASEDDEYKGYFIPKGTIVLMNAWQLMFDPEMYPEPHAFKPERYLLPNGQPNPDGPRPEDVAFGRGRRICPGRYLADEMLYMICVGVLAAFNISPALDKSGKPIQLENKKVGTITLQPPKFECQIKPRSAAIQAIIRDTQAALST